MELDQVIKNKKRKKANYKRQWDTLVYK